MTATVKGTQDVVEGSFVGPLNLNVDNRRFCVARGACPVYSPFRPEERDLGEARRMKCAGGQSGTLRPICLRLSMSGSRLAERAGPPHPLCEDP